jgi:hypothetical protein
MHWDGLASVFVLLASQSLGDLTPTERAWFDALPQGVLSADRRKT